MKDTYLFVNSIYRVLISLVTISILWSLDTNTSIEFKLVQTAILAGYALLFSIFKNNRLLCYVEWLSILALIYFFPEINIIYFLLLIPFIEIISMKAKQIDLLFLTLSISLFEWYLQNGLLQIIAIGAAIYVAGLILNMNFNKISVLEKRLKEEQKDNENLHIENSVKNNQIEVVSKLFIHKQHLDEIVNTDMLVEQMLVSSMDYFNAYYVVLYYYQNGIYHKLADKGDKGKYEVPDKLNSEKGKETFYDRQILRVPLNYEKKSWGSVAIYGKRSRLGEDGKIVSFPFEESDFEILSIYLDSAMMRLKEIRRNDKLKKAALYDRLTAIPNRAYLEGELFTEKLEFVKKERKPFAVFIVDIDNFKGFNDTFGHDIGDEVLKIVARIATETVEGFKQNDVIGRWGGEEFLGYLTGTPKDVYEKVETLRKTIENFHFKYRKITISVGVAFFGHHGTNLTEVSKKADIALYHSKKSGRNMVTIFDREMEK